MPKGDNVMRRNIKRLVVSLTLSIAVVIAEHYKISASAEQTDASKAGWISDEGCAAQHTKPGGADCVEKCWRGGASVGHPEWKPRRAVFIADDNRAVWVVENPEAVKKFPDAHVLVSGKFDSAEKIIHVEKIALAQ
jgi:hypothetical protein